jgi:hypothetical protein
LAPTLIDACGLEVPKTMAGFSLTETDPDRDFVYSEHSLADQRMIRTKTRKLILCKEESLSLYFDLVDDPQEMNNLYTDERYAAEIAELKERFYRWRTFDVNGVGHQNLNADIAKGENSIRDNDPEVGKARLYFEHKREAYHATVPEEDRVTADMLPIGKSIVTPKK